MYGLLERAESEEQMYDFKIGITDFRTGKFNPSCISKIVKTLCAMANTRPNNDGYILIGIPNDKEDAENISKKLNTSLISCRNYKIMGIKAEAEKYYTSIDAYLQRIKDQIMLEPIESSFKNEILTKCQLISYKGKILYLFTCRSSSPVYYDKKLYVRYMSHNHEVEMGSSELNEVMKRFYQ